MMPHRSVVVAGGARTRKRLARGCLGCCMLLLLLLASRFWCRHAAAGCRFAPAHHVRAPAIPSCCVTRCFLAAIVVSTAAANAIASVPRVLLLLRLGAARRGDHAVHARGVHRRRPTLPLVRVVISRLCRTPMLRAASSATAAALSFRASQTAATGVSPWVHVRTAGRSSSHRWCRLRNMAAVVVVVVSMVPSAGLLSFGRRRREVSDLTPWLWQRCLLLLLLLLASRERRR